MDGEIVLDRGNDSVMKLDEREQAMMDEIQLDFGRPHAHTGSAPTIQRMHRSDAPPAEMFQDDVDAFANPSKTGGSPTPTNG
tara:strand:+ start:1104 stop:1349 length:246 start_codon:yes stop_codon:yes gene_type:complete